MSARAGMGACATSLAVSEIPTLLQELKTKFGTIPELKSKYGADGEEAERGGEDAAMQPQRHGHKVLMALSARRFCEHSAPTLILVRAHDHSAVHAPNGMSCMHPYIHTYLRMRLVDAPPRRLLPVDIRPEVKVVPLAVATIFKDVAGARARICRRGHKGLQPPRATHSGHRRMARARGRARIVGTPGRYAR